MNREQAREILGFFRPGSVDEHDSDFAEALAFARSDAGLGVWLDEHCASYETIRSRMRQIAVPTGLKEQILAEQRSPSNIVALPKSSWLKPVLAVAAIMILLLSISSLWPPRSTDHFSTYRNRMVGTALRLYGMDLETNDLSQVRTYLAQKNAPADYVLPDALANRECVGCVVLQWQDRPVSMLCFRTGRPLAPGEKSDLFLFVTARNSFSESSLSVKRVNKLVTASWTEGDKLYLLATHGDEESLRKLL